MNSVSCENCQLRRRETCTKWGNTPCADFRAVPYVPKEEKERWRIAMAGLSYWARFH